MPSAPSTGAVRWIHDTPVEESPTAPTAPSSLPGDQRTKGQRCSQDTLSMRVPSPPPRPDGWWGPPGSQTLMPFLPPRPSHADLQQPPSQGSRRTRTLKHSRGVSLPAWLLRVSLPDNASLCDLASSGGGSDTHTPARGATKCLAPGCSDTELLTVGHQTPFSFPVTQSPCRRAPKAGEPPRR